MLTTESARRGNPEKGFLPAVAIIGEYICQNGAQIGIEKNQDNLIAMIGSILFTIVIFGYSQLLYGFKCGRGWNSPHTRSVTLSGEKVGLILVDHGSRRKDSNDKLIELVQKIETQFSEIIIEPAHMEFAEPTIQQAFENCVCRGAQRVICRPYFLSCGEHVSRDIPNLLRAVAKSYPDVKCSIARPIGLEPGMVDLVAAAISSDL